MFSQKRKSSLEQNLKLTTCPFHAREQNRGDNMDIPGNQLLQHLCAEQFTTVLKGQIIKSRIFPTRCKSTGSFKSPIVHTPGNWEMMQIKTFLKSFSAHY